LNSSGQPRKIDAHKRKGKERIVPFEKITFDPGRLNGQPCVRNLRLTVRRVLEAMATCSDRDELLREYPELEEEDLRQVLEYAAACLDDKALNAPART
jgi:uncharacterized protein (DUF433 family)